jgi:hypothetical protein
MHAASRYNILQYRVVRIINYVSLVQEISDSCLGFDFYQNIIK